MAEENQEDNKKIAQDIGDSLSDTFKKSFSIFTKSQTKSTTGFLKSAEDLVDENKAEQESFANSLASIKDAILSTFPKVIESIKASLSPPASKPSAGVTTPEVKVSADSPAPKDAPSKDDPSGFFTDLGKKMDKGILGLFGDKKETKDSTPEIIKESNTSIVDTLKERFI